jgi:hypothetical protein
LAVPLRWGLVTLKTVGDIKTIPSLIKDKKYNKAEILAEKGTNNLNKIDTKISEWGLNNFVLGRNYQSGLKVLIDFLSLEKSLPQTAQAADNINEAIFKEKEINWTSELNNFKAELWRLKIISEFYRRDYWEIIVGYQLDGDRAYRRKVIL